MRIMEEAGGATSRQPKNNWKYVSLSIGISTRMVIVSLEKKADIRRLMAAARPSLACALRAADNHVLLLYERRLPIRNENSGNA